MEGDAGTPQSLDGWDRGVSPPDPDMEPGSPRADDPSMRGTVDAVAFCVRTDIGRTILDNAFHGGLRVLG